MSKSSTVTVRERPVSEVTTASAGGLMIHGETIIISTDERVEVVDLTERVMAFVKKLDIREGIVSLWSLHTTCTICDRMNADSHIRALLLGHSLTLQVSDGEIVLGQWQRVLMGELDGPRARTLRLQVWGVGE